VKRGSSGLDKYNVIININDHHMSNNNNNKQAWREIAMHVAAVSDFHGRGATKREREREREKKRARDKPWKENHEKLQAKPPPPLSPSFTPPLLSRPFVLTVLVQQHVGHALSDRELPSRLGADELSLHQVNLVHGPDNRTVLLPQAFRSSGALYRVIF